MTLREILLTLRRRFWLVIAGALVAGVVAGVLSLVWPPTYEARAQLLMIRLRLDVTLDPRFQTVSGEGTVSESVQQDQVRRQTLVGLADSSDVARKVLDRLAPSLSPQEQRVGYLKGVTDIQTDGNLIIFQVRAKNPDKAADIANAWAEVYQEYVNRLYSATSPSDAQIQSQVASAQTSYETAESAVEAFLQQNQEDELTRQIDQKKRVLADLQTAYLAAAKDREDTLLAYINRIDQLVLQAQSLKQQLANVSGAASLTAGEQFSLFSLESVAFSQPEDVPVTLEIGQGWPLDSNLTAQQALGQLDHLVDSALAAKSSAQQELAGLTADLIGGTDLLASASGDAATTSIAKLQEEINSLQAELERQKTLKQDLLDARDIANDNYLTLVRKAGEVQILSQLTGVEVEIAAPAQPPERPVFPRPLLTTVLGVMVGGLAGLALAFVWELWPNSPAARATGV